MNTPLSRTATLALYAAAFLTSAWVGVTAVEHEQYAYAAASALAWGALLLAIYREFRQIALQRHTTVDAWGQILPSMAADPRHSAARSDGHCTCDDCP